MTKHMITIVGCYIALTGAVLGGKLTIYSQDFNVANSALNDSAVTYAAAGYDTTWSADSTFGTDGSFTNSGTQGAAVLDFAPVLDETYRLDVSFREMNSGYDFYVAGFACSGLSEGAAPFKGNPNGLGYMDVVRNGNVTGWGYKNISQERIGSKDIGTGIDVDLRIELTKVGANNYDYTFYAKMASDPDYTEIASTNTYSYGSRTINRVGFGVDDSPITTSGRITAFHLYQPVTFGTVVSVK